MEPLCQSIRRLFGGYFYVRSRSISFKGAAPKKYHSYTVITRSFRANGLVCNYFDKYPMFGTKQLNYLNWRRIYMLIACKQHLTERGITEYKRIKLNHNTAHSTWTWAHLSLFYAEPKLQDPVRIVRYSGARMNQRTEQNAVVTTEIPQNAAVRLFQPFWQPEFWLLASGSSRSVFFSFAKK